MTSPVLRVSVAMCTYNGARYVGEQLGSILDQTNRPNEIVIADDGSTDGTLGVVREIWTERQPGDVSLNILAQGARLGVTANFQRAIDATRGDLVALSDQDDVWHPERLSLASAAFRADESLLLQNSDARLVDASGRPLGMTLLDALRVSAVEHDEIDRGQAFHAYIRRNLVTGATVMFRRSLMAAAAPFPSEWVHDEWLAIIAAATGRVMLSDVALIDYRQHGSNAIGVASPTLGYRIGRMLEPRADRYARLSARATVLVAKLQILGVDASIVDLAVEKERFEAVRASLPAFRPARVAAVLRELRAGSYSRLSSQGIADVVRDLVQRS